MKKSVAAIASAALLSSIAIPAANAAEDERSLSDRVGSGASNIMNGHSEEIAAIVDQEPYIRASSPVAAPTGDGFVPGVSVDAATKELVTPKLPSPEDAGDLDKKVLKSLDSAINDINEGAYIQRVAAGTNKGVQADQPLDGKVAELIVNKVGADLVAENSSSFLGKIGGGVSEFNPFGSDKKSSKDDKEESEDRKTDAEKAVDDLDEQIEDALTKAAGSSDDKDAKKQQKAVSSVASAYEDATRQIAEAQLSLYSLFANDEDGELLSVTADSSDEGMERGNYIGGGETNIYSGKKQKDVEDAKIKSFETTADEDDKESD